MDIKNFIRDFSEKKICADVSLPKYQNLLDKKVVTFVKEAGNDQAQFFQDTINEIEMAEKIVTGTLNLPEHVADVLKNDYTTISQYITCDNSIQNFNRLIKVYLEKESGYSANFSTKKSRPASGVNNFRFIDSNVSYVNNPINSWVSAEEAITFGSGLPKDLCDAIRPSFFDRIKSVFSKKHHDKIYAETYKSMQVNSGNPKYTQKSEDDKAYPLTIEDFFSQVKIKTAESDNFKNHISTIFKQIDNAMTMGQTALIESLTQRLIVEIYEAALLGAGMTRYIDFATLKELEAKSPRGLCIDFPQNFARIIPQEIIEKKNLVDALCIFDHYVILHFDPEKKNTKQTQEEIEENKKKDPILFGIILDSPKLYYIADWIDDFCDLTWDKALEILDAKDDELTLKYQK